MRFVTPLYKSLFLAFALCAIPAHANDNLFDDIQTLQQDIVDKQLRLNSYQQKLDSEQQQQKTLNSDISSARLALKKLNYQQRKIQALAEKPATQATKENLRKIAYKKRVAELTLDKSSSKLSAIGKERTKLENRIRRVNNVITSLQQELDDKQSLQRQSQSHLAAKVKQAKAKRLKQQRKKAQQKALTKKRQQQALAKIKAQKKEAEKATQQLKQQEESLALMKKISALPPAEAALMRAEYVASLDRSGASKLGDSPQLQVLKGRSKKPKSLGSMHHLGNNQYSASITARKGRQRFLIGPYSFEKIIPKNFNGLRCLVLLDAREETANFQLIVKKR